MKSMLRVGISRATTSATAILLLSAALALSLAMLTTRSILAQEAQEIIAPDVLPDLQMELQNVRVETKKLSGQRKRLLLFDSIIKNPKEEGVGNFELIGPSPASDTTDKQVTQRIYDATGGSRDVLTSAIMRWDGDGHNHWHVWDLQDFVLYRVDNGSKSYAGQANKHGFCFFDNYDLSTKTTTTTPPPGHYQYDCDADVDAVKMGLTPGWGDLYSASIGTGQYLDVTNLPTGNYVLEATADKSDWFDEKDEANNTASVKVAISNRK